jgi:hypothetical protein
MLMGSPFQARDLGLDGICVTQGTRRTILAGFIGYKLFGSIGFLVGFGILFLVFAVRGLIAVRRGSQGEDVRKEYQRQLGS